jgi:myo-inositol-1(or 4)-monophosphatase
LPVIDDLTLLEQAAQEAGDIALRHFRADPQVWEKDNAAGPVTEADLAVDRYLRDKLLTARPGNGWLSEETEDDADRLSADHVFIIDPIDGTRAFIDHSEDWALSLAVAERGAISAAVVYLPARGLLYRAARGRGATLNGAPITVTGTQDATGAEVLTTKPNLAPGVWRGPVPSFRRSFRTSLAYRLCLVAEGRFDAMLTLRPTWEWDVAAGSLIVAEAGGTATDGNGGPARFNNPHPQIAGMVAGGALHGALMGELRRDLSQPGPFTLPG